MHIEFSISFSCYCFVLFSDIHVMWDIIGLCGEFILGFISKNDFNLKKIIVNYFLRIM